MLIMCLVGGLACAAGAGGGTANHDPVIQEVASSADSQFIGLDTTVTLTCNATDADGDPLTYQWNMITGNGPHDQAQLATGVGKTVTLYTGPTSQTEGTTQVDIEVICMDDKGGSDMEMVTYTITNLL
jgi:hypothetical protein